MDYKEKLKKFNSTEKYQQELDMMYYLLNPKLGEKILDYGCGTGYAMRYFESRLNPVYYHGYDVDETLFDLEDKTKLKTKIWFELDKYYFLHSLAHIPNIQEVLKEQVYTHSKGEVSVITPNRLWIEKQDSKNYVPDPTVFKHYSQKELIALFEFCGYDIIMCGQFGNLFDGQNERIFLKAIKNDQ